jgi:hypothetical protein
MTYRKPIGHINRIGEWHEANDILRHKVPVPEGLPIVAWHEVPGTAPSRKDRPVGYGVIRVSVRTSGSCARSFGAQPVPLPQKKPAPRERDGFVGFFFVGKQLP